jgi:hypothetical protein
MPVAKRWSSKNFLGHLLNADKVREQAFRICRQVRDAMLNIPDRLEKL